MKTFNTKIFYVMDYHEFDRLVAEEYSQPEYQVVVVEGWSNDTEHVAYVDSDIDRDDVQEIGDWQAGRINRTPGWSTLLADMCANGIIPMGDYLITVMW